MKGLLANMWDNKESVVGGIFDIFSKKNESKLGDDFKYSLLARNFIPDMKEGVDDLQTIIDNPRVALKSALELGGGAIGKLTPDFIDQGLLKIAPNNLITSENTSQMASDAYEDIKKNLGSLDAVKKTIQNNPFDTLLAASGIGAVANQVRKVSTPTLKKALAQAEANGLMDEIRKVGSTPVGLSMKDVSIKNPMIATHNMSEEALMKHTGQGYNKIPMPSMAISKTDGLLENFGDITLLGTPKMITPSATTNTYNSDMYSGRAPHDFTNYKNIDKVFNSVNPQEMQWHIGHTAPNWLKDGDIDYTTETGKGYLQTMRRKFEDWSPGQLERQMLNVDTAKANGYNPYDYENYREMVREINKAHKEKHGNMVGRLLTYNSDTVPPSGLLGESIQMMSNPKGYRTPSGKRRADVPYDPELALKIMKKKKAYLPGTEMEGNSVGQTRALTSKKFKNLQEIKDSRDSIVQRGLFHDIGDEFELARDDVRLAIKNDKRTRISYNDNDNVYDMIEEMLRGNGKVPEEYMSMFDQSTRENLTWVEDLVKELKNKGKELETTYFESKSNRLVDINEFKGALIPKETSKYIEKLLKDAGIQKILRYGSSKERMELLKKFPELQFIGLAMPTSGLLMSQDKDKQGLLL